MKNTMIRFPLVCLAAALLWSPLLEAQARVGSNAVSVGLGFFGNGGAFLASSNNTRSQTLSGLFGLGGDFEHFIQPDTSIGAIFRYYNTSDSLPSGAGTADATETLMTLGGLLKAYLLTTPNWDGYLSTGLGYVAATAKLGTGATVDPSGFGFYLGFGALYKWNSDIAFGFENLRMIALGDKINGWPLNDFLLKARFAF